MAMRVPLLDDQDFNIPPALNELPEQNINAANNFCWYFYVSQFNEPACNNTAILNQHRDDPASNHIIHDRKIFDDRLRSIPSGLQFVVAGESQGEGQPWLYQRQNKVEVDNRIETSVEGNWYNQGTRIAMAPSLLDVVRARLLTVSTRMQQIAELSQEMTHWSPATGHSYLPPTFDAPKAAIGSRAGSRIGSPTLAAMDLDQSQGTVTAAVADPVEATEEFSDALFMQSLLMTNRYGDEYMDENPLKGEPGAFVFTNTRNAVDERNKAQEQAASSQINALKLDTQPPSVAPSVAPTPKAAPTPIDTHSRKGSVAPLTKKEKKERRKSKGPASPTTPGPGLPPAA